MLKVLLLILHILSVMLAFGASASIGFWAGRAHAEPAHLGFMLRSLQKLDRFLIDPGYGLGGITGIALVQVSGVPWTVLWVEAGMLLWVIALGLTHGLLRPTMRRQIAALEADGPTSAEYLAVARKSQGIGLSLSLIAIAIVVLMVWKPI